MKKPLIIMLAVFVASLLVFSYTSIVSAQEDMNASSREPTHFEESSDDFDDGPDDEDFERGRDKREFRGPEDDEFDEPADRDKGPREIPKDILRYVPESDFVEMFCLMTKWKASRMTFSLDAIGEAFAKAKVKLAELGIDIQLPDVFSLKADAQAKIDAVCNAATIAEAEAATKEIKKFGENRMKSAFANLHGQIESAMRSRAEKLRKSIGDEVRPLIELEKAAMQEFMRAETERLRAELRTQLESQSEGQMEQIQQQVSKDSIPECRFDASSGPPTEEQVETCRAKLREAQQAAMQSAGPQSSGPSGGDLESDLRAEIEQKMEEMRTKARKRIEEKAKEFGREHREKMESIGDIFRINKRVKEKMEAMKDEIEALKDAAIRKRKEITIKITLAKIEEGFKKLESARDDIEALKKEDPSVKSVDEILAEMRADKDALIALINVATTEEEIERAIEAFREKWENHRALMSKNFEKLRSAKRICGLVIDKLKDAKENITESRDNVNGIIEKCGDDPSAEGCGGYAEKESNLKEFARRADNVLRDIEHFEDKCAKVADDSPRADIINSAEKLREAGEDLKEIGDRLKE